MTITNIGTLQDAVESRVERVGAMTDATFLEWANAVAHKLMYGVMGPSGRIWLSPPLRIREMTTTDTLTTSGGSVALPSDWLEFERLWINANDGGDLSYIPLNAFRSDPESQLTGTPTKYTLDGQTLYIAPTTDHDIEVSYYQTLGAFTGDSSTDTILTNHPRVYLHGLTAEACEWDGDYARADREMMQFASAVRGLNIQNKQAQSKGGVLRMRPRWVS